MAQSIACDLCGEESAVLMQTNLSSGDTIAVGQACLVTFSLANAVAFSEGAEAEEQATYADLVAALLANLAPSMLQLAKSAVPKPPRRGKAPGRAPGGQEGASEVSGDGSAQGDVEGVSDALSATADS